MLKNACNNRQPETKTVLLRILLLSIEYVHIHGTQLQLTFDLDNLLLSVWSFHSCWSFPLNLALRSWSLSPEGRAVYVACCWHVGSSPQPFGRSRLHPCSTSHVDSVTRAVTVHLHCPGFPPGPPWFSAVGTLLRC